MGSERSPWAVVSPGRSQIPSLPQCPWPQVYSQSSGLTYQWVWGPWPLIQHPHPAEEALVSFHPWSHVPGLWAVPSGRSRRRCGPAHLHCVLPAWPLLPRDAHLVSVHLGIRPGGPRLLYAQQCRREAGTEVMVPARSATARSCHLLHQFRGRKRAVVPLPHANGASCKHPSHTLLWDTPAQAPGSGGVAAPGSCSPVAPRSLHLSPPASALEVAPLARI